VNKSWQR